MNHQEWVALSMEEKEAHMHTIEEKITKDSRYLSENIRFKGMISIQNGAWQTGLFSAANDAEFIYFPANQVTLGFDCQSEIPADFLAGLEEDFRELWPERFTDQIDREAMTRLIMSEMMSPERKGSIREMLVERRYWEHVDRYDPKREKDTEIKYVPGSVISDDFAMGGIRFGSFDEEEMLASLHAHGFDACTEDEYEYLVGGGTRQIYAENLMESAFQKDGMSLQLIEESQPNVMGLWIAYNSFHWEYVNSPCLCKGGDGGGASSYGVPWLDYLTVSPFYRPDEPWLEYDFVRRMVDVEQIHPTVPQEGQ